MEPIALDSGVMATDYWGMTYVEIVKQVESNNRRRESELKEKAYYDYTLANLFAVASNDPKKMPKADKAYPILGDMVSKPISEEEAKAKKLEALKAHFKAKDDKFKAIQATKEG